MKRSRSAVKIRLDPDATYKISKPVNTWKRVDSKSNVLVAAAAAATLNNGRLYHTRLHVVKFGMLPDYLG